MKCKKCGKTFPKKTMMASGIKGKSKYFARYYCPICSLNPKKNNWLFIANNTRCFGYSSLFY